MANGPVTKSFSLKHAGFVFEFIDEKTRLYYFDLLNEVFKVCDCIFYLEYYKGVF